MTTNALDDIFATDKSTEEDGAWVDLTPTIRLKIRAFGAKAVTDLREKLMKPYVLLQRSGQKIPDEQSDDIGLKVIAGGVIADWSGVPGSDGASLPYTADNAYDTLKRLPRMANFVIGISTDAQFYKNDVVEDGAKN